jgi:Ca2+-binding RTX toxin-like protein
VSNTGQLTIGGSAYNVESAGQSYSVTQPSTGVLRFEVHSGDRPAGDSTGIERSEVAGATRFSSGTPIHVSYNWMVEPGQANNASWLVAGQIHTVVSNGISPPFAIYMSGDKMTIRIDEAGSNANAYSYYKTIYTDTANIVRGHNYAMQIDADFGANGYLHVARDGVTLVDYHGPLGYANMGQVYWKEGIYRADASNPIAMDYGNLSVTSGSTPAATPVTTPIATAATAPAATATTTTVATATTTAATHLTAVNGDVHASQTTPGLEGGAGADTLTGFSGHDTLYGGDGADRIVGGSGFNVINGNKGDDVIIGHSQTGDYISGGQGGDWIDLTASSGHNVVNGNKGADLIIGGAGGDTMRGGQGDDLIYGGKGDDWISGDLGNNTIYGGQGVETFHAGAGHDVVHAWHAGDQVQIDQGVTFSLTQASDGVHVNFSNGGEMDLVGVQVNQLQANWIIH